MSTKKVCDRCGKELKPRSILNNLGNEIDRELDIVGTLYKYGYKRERRWDLCRECTDKIISFVEDYKGEMED